MIHLVYYEAIGNDSEIQEEKGQRIEVAHAIALACNDDRASGRDDQAGEEPNTQNRETSPARDWVREIGLAAKWCGEEFPVRDLDLPEWEAEGCDEDKCASLTPSPRLREELPVYIPHSADK
ncbi:MAG TPA: hypothetical protein VFV52_10110 [Bacilli bacterium]|nr:hypothetical protein [Bacilli bacterium]